MEIPFEPCLGIKGEPSTPADPAQGFVWQSIVKHIDCRWSRRSVYFHGGRASFDICQAIRGVLVEAGSANVKEMIELSCRFNAWESRCRHRSSTCSSREMTYSHFDAECVQSTWIY